MPSGWNTHFGYLGKMIVNNLNIKRNTVTWHLTSPPPEFDLVPLEVGLVLHHFDKTLQNNMHQFKISGTRLTLVYWVTLKQAVRLSLSSASLDRANISSRAFGNERQELAQVLRRADNKPAG